MDMDLVTERILYVLALEGGYYYIGQSTSAESRIKKQFKGTGSAFTKKYKPLKVVEQIEVAPCTYKDAEFLENDLTLNYMLEYGWRMVRGGHFCNTDETTHFKSLVSHQKRQTMPRISELSLD